MAFLVLLFVLSTGDWGCGDKTFAEEKEKVKAAAIVNVEEVVARPQKFKGAFSVAGTIKKVVAAKHIFYLGCEDACVLMPVKYQGSLPQKINAKVVVTGKISREKSGKYFLKAQKVSLQ